MSVGNLTVGGTGKTPVAAWIAAELSRRGCRPAVLLRGYGDDEPLVHRRLLPGVPVVADPDRVAGAGRVGEGVDVLVLDDAFQHRRARRDVDVVLVSADRWDGQTRALPAGPFRDALSALRRADLVLITRKHASDEQVERAAAAIRDAAPDVALAVGALKLEGVTSVSGPEVVTRPLVWLDARPVLAIAAIGDPGAFAAQLEACGAQVSLAAYADHHAFTTADAALLAARAHEVAESGGAAICTLKDAVKLARLWPRAAPPLWYVSQRLYLERGSERMEALLDRLAALRTPRHPSAG